MILQIKDHRGCANGLGLLTCGVTAPRVYQLVVMYENMSWKRAKYGTFYNGKMQVIVVDFI